MRLTWKTFDFDFSRRTYIMGILNVTPDSFSDGGLFLDRGRAVDRACAMEQEGADMIDIGGESTRPGASRVTVKDEIGRVVPVIEAVAHRVRIPISIDTCKAAVAEAALSAGASVVNDISGLHFDGQMAAVVSRNRVPVIIMHIQGTPENMQQNPKYTALVPEITDYFHESIDLARKAGIADDMIILDPGIGFGKTVKHNLAVIHRLNSFAGFEKPILLGHSRKSFVGNVLGGQPASDRLEGTAAVAAIAVMKGANIIRVHDVKEMVRVVRMADAVKRA